MPRAAPANAARNKLLLRPLSPVLLAFFKLFPPDPPLGSFLRSTLFPFHVGQAFPLLSSALPLISCNFRGVSRRDHGSARRFSVVQPLDIVSSAEN